MKKVILASAFALSFTLGADVLVEDIFVRQSAPNSKNTAIFFTIENKSGNDIKIIDAKSSNAKTTELHTHKKEGDKSMMIKVDSMHIKANSKLELKPGSDHIMLFDLKKPIGENDTADLILYFDDNTSLQFDSIKSKNYKR